TNISIDNISQLENKFNAKIEQGSSFDNDISDCKTIRIFRENTKVNLPAVIEGSAVQPGQILLDPAFANANGYKIGDSFSIENKSYKIAGFFSLPNYIYIIKSQSDLLSDAKTFGIAMLSKNDFDSYQSVKTFYSIKFGSNTQNVQTQAEAFRSELTKQGVTVTQWTDTANNNRVTIVTAKIDGIGKVSTFLPVVILLLTCVLTGIVILRMIKQESIIIGTLYAQGYRKKEIINHYIRYPLIIAILGGIIGTILGILTIKPMTAFMLEYFNIPLSKSVVTPVHIIISLLLPIIFLTLSALYILIKELRYSPVSLMRGEAKSSKVNVIERKARLDKLKFKTKFKLREQFRSTSRLVFLLFGVVLATMLLLLGFTAKSSMDYLMGENLTGTLLFKYEYVYNSFHFNNPSAGAETFSGGEFAMKKDGNDITFTLSGIKPDTKMIALKDKAGNVLDTNKTIITMPLADKLGVKEGGSIEVTSKVTSKTFKVTVDKIADSYVGEYIFMPIDKFNSLVGYPEGSYIGLWSNNKLDIDEKYLYSATSIDETINNFKASMQPLQSALGVMGLLAFIIGLVVIHVVISLIIEENRSTISLMKVFGYRKKEINSLILNSPFIIIVIGYILGIPVIMNLMGAAFKSITQNIDIAFPIVINYVYLIIGFVVVYLMYELSKALNKRKLNKIDMSEALKSGKE
ncbi:MAG: FtsX-like permease family protein, partial [Eubacteriaceae bacterium]|nr:FtsX-like permease family protein [Eubacteriaceae bacterium]